MATTNTKDYSWMDPHYLGLPSKHTKMDEGVKVLFEVGSNSDWKILVTLIKDTNFNTPT